MKGSNKNIVENNDVNTIYNNNATQKTTQNKVSLWRHVIQFLSLFVVQQSQWLYRTPSKINPVPSNLDIPPYIEPNTLLSNASIIFKNRIQMPGPEHLAIDETLNRGYVGAINGKIISLDMEHPFTSVPIHICDIGEPYKALPSPCGKYDTLDVCGRVLGIVVDEEHNLIVADASKGIIYIDLKNKRITPLVKHVETSNKKKEKLIFTNSLQLDKDRERIYFTISSKKFTLKDLFLDILEFRPNGALAMYDMKKKKAKIITPNLYFANGIVFNKDESYVLVSETTMARILKISVHESTYGKIEIWADNLPCFPDNLSIVGDEIWVGGILRKPSFYNNALQKLLNYPTIRKIIGKFTTSAILSHLIPSSGIVVRLDSKNGSVVGTLQDSSTNPRVKYVAGAYYHRGYV